APASRAAAAVPSVDPSSTTITMSTPGRPAAARTVAAMRSDSFLAGITTATSPLGGTMAAILVGPRTWQLLLPGHRRGVVEHREHALQAGHLQDLPYRRARGGELEVATLLTRLPVRGEQHFHAGRIPKFDPGHVNDYLHRAVSGEKGNQLPVEPGCGV